MKSRRHTNAVVCLLLVRAIVSVPSAEADDEALPLHQQIDELIGKRLVELTIAPAIVSGDAEFVRRVYLDLAGVIPTATQARAFLDDSAPGIASRMSCSKVARSFMSWRISICRQRLELCESRREQGRHHRRGQRPTGARQVGHRAAARLGSRRHGKSP